VRHYGNFETAEDAVQEALLAAAASPFCQHQWSRGTAGEVHAAAEPSTARGQTSTGGPGGPTKESLPKCCLAKSPWLL
jgi:hypothetical protein